MKKILLALSLLLPSMAFAAGGGVALQKAHNDIDDKASLQTGAKLFVNYCMGCHSAHFSRYQRVADDLGLTVEQTKENLMPYGGKIGDTMTISMDNDDAKQWFGTLPPDLSVIARARGTDWLYSYLLGFYLDPSRPLGVNNTIFKDVGMPHVLWELQGWQKAVHTEHGIELELVDKDKMTEDEYKAKTAEYRRNVRDLVNFLEYVGEPAQLQRKELGKWVLLFLFLLFGLTYLLKKEFWRDIH